MKRILLASAALAALLPGVLACAAGADGAQFLRLGSGARPLAMGEAYVAIAEEADALAWNPAGMAGPTSPALAASHAEYLGFVHYDTVYSVLPSRALGGGFGLGAAFLTHDAIGSVDNLGNETGERFRPQSLLLAAGYARRLQLGSARLDLGAGGRWFRETLHDRSATAVAGDVGAQLGLLGSGWRLGAAGRHLGGRTKFLRDSSPLPGEIVAGVGYDAGDERRGWTASAEAAAPLHSAVQARAGFEGRRPISSGAALALRGGFNTRGVAELGLLGGFSAGAGVAFERAYWDLSFQDRRELGRVFHFTFGWRFRPAAPRERFFAPR